MATCNACGLTFCQYCDIIITLCGRYYDSCNRRLLGPNELGKQTQWKEDKIENAKNVGFSLTSGRTYTESAFTK